MDQVWAQGTINMHAKRRSDTHTLPFVLMDVINQFIAITKNSIKRLKSQSRPITELIEDD